ASPRVAPRGFRGRWGLLMATSESTQEKTGLGNYFVANYPPFSFWKPDHLPAARAALNAPPKPGTPLGLYLHIPFCRKRCKFCYFKVYTDKNASEIERYLNALIKENELYSRTNAFQGRQLRFAYFGGGTPSYISERQLDYLVEGLNRHVSWAGAEEVTFECEPGTIRKSKLETLKQIGVTRLSLGIEHFDDGILEANGRAHLSPEVYQAYAWAREVNFQNADSFEEYIQLLDADRLPLYRALPLSAKQNLIREMILQLKTGAIQTEYFSRKFDVDVWEEFHSTYSRLEREGLLALDNG